KKRERIAALEAQVKSGSSSSTNTAQEDNLVRINDSPELEESERVRIPTPPPPNDDVQDDVQVGHNDSSEEMFQLHEAPFAFLPDDEQTMDLNLLSASNMDEFFPPGLTSGSS